MADVNFMREVAVQSGITTIGALGAGLKAVSAGCSDFLGPLLMLSTIIWTIARIIKTVRETPPEKKGKNESTSGVVSIIADGQTNSASVVYFEN